LDGLHGLIAETQDQSTSSFWNAQDIISINSNHSTAGKLYTDWRLPTKNELNLLYIQRGQVGSGWSEWYWSSKEFDDSPAWKQRFTDGVQRYENKDYSNSVRAVRTF
jgi:hypothetical protein